MTIFRSAVLWLAWPVLFGAALFTAGYGFANGQPLLLFNLAYFSLAIILLVLERVMPYERQWAKYDGQLIPDIAHTLTSKGTVQGLMLFGGVIGLTELVTTAEQTGYSIWPREWPMFAQVVMGLVAAEFGLYWAHRLAHEWPFLWRFHAIHHSVTRLWVVNTGRFHFVDSVVSILLGIAILLALGAPMEVIKWLSAVTAFIGLLTHCNVDMRFGPISWVFNTPGLHRWHHSRDIREGNRNYCENLMIWDQVFGTYINPNDRRPPVNIGIDDFMPARFTEQLAWPFLSARQKERRIVHEPAE